MKKKLLLKKNSVITKYCYNEQHIIVNICVLIDPLTLMTNNGYKEQKNGWTFKLDCTNYFDIGRVIKKDHSMNDQD